MAAQQEVLAALVRILLNRKLISQAVHDSALGIIRSGRAFPAFFEEGECCRGEGLDGYPQDPE